MVEIRIPLYIPELEVLMADVKDTQAKVEALSGQIDQMQARVQEDVQALKDQLAAAGVDQAVLDEVNQGLDTIASRVQQIDPDPENPPAS
jgi:outer membrane murein-binding lipoprotein Lpp